jgi:hypothetical protein
MIPRLLPRRGTFAEPASIVCDFSWVGVGSIVRAGRV